MVDTDLFPIDTQPRNLSVKIGEIATLEERIVAEPDPRDDMGSTECNLLGLWEEFLNRAIQNKFTDRLERDKILGPDFGCVKDVEFEFMFVLL